MVTAPRGRAGRRSFVEAALSPRSEHQTAEADRLGPIGRDPAAASTPGLPEQPAVHPPGRPSVTDSDVT